MEMNQMKYFRAIVQYGSFSQTAKRLHLTIAVSTQVFIKHLILKFLQQYPEVSFTCHLMTMDEIAHASEESIRRAGQAVRDALNTQKQ